MDKNQVLVSRLLLASRALAAIAARSLDDLDTSISLSQFRVLVVLGEHGPINLSELARQVGVHVSTAQRLCGELADRQLLHRTTAGNSGSAVTVTLTDTGQRLVEQVMRRRQEEFNRIVGSIPVDQRVAVAAALEAFADAADSSHPSWSYGWSQAADEADSPARTT